MSIPLSPAELPSSVLERIAAPIGNGSNGDSVRLPPSGNGSNGEKHLPDAPSGNGSNGRDSHGRFAKGNPGGPGNPFARRIGALRRALCDEVSEEDVRGLARQLLERAKNGDLAAMKLLFVYAIGRPGDAVDPDTLDLKEWQLFRQIPIQANDLGVILNGMPAPMACTILRAAWPVVAERLAQGLAERLLEPVTPEAPHQEVLPAGATQGPVDGRT
jgi:hypothetical protein